MQLKSILVDSTDYFLIFSNNLIFYTFFVIFRANVCDNHLKFTIFFVNKTLLHPWNVVQSYEDCESDGLSVIKESKEIYDCEKNISKLAFVVLEYLETHALLDQSVAILDYGCGNGDVAKFLSQKLNYTLFTCIDISQKAIDAARKNCENLRNFEILCGDVSAINQPYDIILLSSVYHFLNKKQRSALISKIKRFLNPGGLLFLLTLSTDDQQYYGKGKPITDVNDPNSFIYDEGYYLHFSSKNEFQTEFNFLKKERLDEFYGKNYTKDTEFFSCWIFTGKKLNNATV